MENKYKRFMLTAVSKKRFFVRFGEIPKSGLSKLWTAPNAFHLSNVGKDLPGLSVYEAFKNGNKWEISTETLNMGSGIASLSDCLYKVSNKDYDEPVYLLSGTPVRWKDFTPEERKTFADYYPGKGAEKYDLEGTDGEPLLRNFQVIKKLTAYDLTNRLMNYPKDYDLEEPK